MSAVANPTLADSLRAYAAETLKSNAAQFITDLEAITEEDLSRSWGKGSRLACDIAYEVGIVNRRIAARLRGEDPGPPPWKFGEEWIVAPEQFRNREALVALIRESGEELLNAFGVDIEREIKIGESVSQAYKMVLGAAIHMDYHDAQFNFIQSMNGDLSVHGS